MEQRLSQRLGTNGFVAIHLVAIVALDLRCETLHNTRMTNTPTTAKDYPVVIEFPIQWGDLDAYGHVNNLAYLRWFEAARAEYARKVGVVTLPGQPGVGGIVASLRCKYLRSVAYPGVVSACVRINKLTIAGVSLEFQIFDAATGVPAASGGCEVVLVDIASEKPVPIPDDIRAAVETLEGKEFLA